MIFGIDRDDLNSAINTVTKALPVKPMNNMLERIYIQTGAGGVKLVCCDSTLQIDTFAEAMIEEPGTVLLPGRLFADVVRKMPAGLLNVEITEGERPVATVRCQGSKTQLQGLGAEDYPFLAVYNKEYEFEMRQTALKDLLAKTAFAVSVDESRPILTGVCFEINRNSLKMVAMDGYRLASSACNIYSEKEGAAIIPASSLSEIAKELSEDDEDMVKIAVSRSNAFFDLGRTHINTVLVSGKYVDYEKLLPKEKKTTVILERRELMDALDRAFLMAREGKSNLVRLDIDGESITITSNSEIGNVRDEIFVKTTGSTIEIAFNVKYMLDVLKAIKDDQIMMEINTNITPCVVRPVQGNEYYYLVLPVRSA